MSAHFAGFSNVVVVVPSCSLLGVSEHLTVTLLCYGRAPWSYLQLNEALLIYYINMLYLFIFIYYINMLLYKQQSACTEEHGNSKYP